MHYTIYTILLSLFAFSLQAQWQTIAIDWSIQAQNPFNQQQQESFYEASYQNSQNFIPTYTQWFTFNGENASIQISNQVFEPFNGKGINTTDLKKEIEVRSSIGIAKKQKELMLSFIPLRVNEYTGEIEKLVQFDVEIIPNNTTNYNFKSNKSTKTVSSLANGTWHKIAISKDGIFKIDASFLDNNNISRQNLSFSDFGVFGQAMGILPEANSEARVDDIEEIPIKIFDGNNNGIWDNSDYILFYGKGPHTWNYDVVGNRWRHNYNLYSERSGYFLTTNKGSGLQLNEVNSISPSAFNTNIYNFRAFYEQEINNLIYTQLVSTMGSGREWYGEKLSTFNNSQNISFPIPNINSSVPATIQVRYAATSYVYNSTMSFRNNGSLLFNTSIGIASSGDYPNAGVAAFDVRQVNLSNNNNIELVFNNNDAQSSGFLDYIEIIAEAEIQLDENFLFFRSTENIGPGNTTTFQISNANANTEVWDITSGVNVFKVSGNLIGNTYQISIASDSLREFVAINTGNINFELPEYVVPIANQNLHGLPQLDMFIITNSALVPAANRLADFHQNEGISVAVVELEKIYNEFSSGMQDLSAIRDFLKMFYDRSTSFATLPKYALLLGDASFDYKDRIDGNENIVPTYQSQESFSQVSSYCTDDFIGFLDSNEGEDITNISNPNRVDVAIGRIPVDDLEEANGVVDKILSYNTIQTQEDWRNILSFVADDEDNNLHFGQVEQLTSLSNIEEIEDYNIDKIYLDAYTQTNAAGGDRYPDVNDAILRRIRSGTFLINYTGHGGPKNWAQERVFNIEDIRNLDNIDKLPLFITATCDFSPYDDPEFHSAGENLITNPNGGAIALITTTRLVFAFQNFDMNSRVLDYLFQEYEGRMPTVGEILLQAKNGASASENNRKFVLLGDPALTLAYPKHQVFTTKINGLPINQIDTLKALSKVTIEGEIRDQNGVLLNDFNGVVFPSVYDKVAEYQTKGQDADSNIDEFELQNKVLFKGKASVVNGKFSFEFIVPKDINYAFNRGKISYYAASNTNQIDANGHSFDFIVGGTASNYLADDRGPKVDVFINDTTFAFGGLSDENPILLVNLQDESGINTVGNGVGHDIVGLLNENTQKQYSLNDFYSAKLDDFTRGNIEYPFNKLEDGRYSVRVKAWDVHNNPGEGYTEFIVAASAELALQNVFNYPNPFTTQTSFIFEHNRPGEVLQVSVQIFTVSGKLIKNIDTQVITDGYRVNPDEITWNGLDDYGDLIGKGVYVYKINVQGENGYSAQEFEKLVILR